MRRVLVAYASKMGATKEIAEEIRTELERRGVHAEAHNVCEVVSAEFYDAVVLGTAVYAGRWRPEAVRFVKRHATELKSRPLWLFESGWVGKRPEAVTATPGGRRRAARLGAEPPTVFGGRLDPGLATGWFDRALAKRMPGDCRDFDEIHAWATQIADALLAAAHG
jgi:menaquinone-dependent protoporphyrinogen oxidase